VGSFATNLAQIQSTIDRHAEKAGRDPADVRIVAVTKTFPVERIREAIAAGHRAFGENRVQEALPKLAELSAEDCEWHLIGHLQTNKARMVEGFSMIQSIDSIRVVEALAARLRRPLDVLIEVNVGEEPQKTGASPWEIEPIVSALRSTPALRLKGLMTIAPMTDDPEAARPFFRSLRLLRDESSQRFGVELPELSMGMTDDYPVALEEGATLLRLGRALFGPRSL
jgi:pyridoxal phosphate enzyme (YggS family)